MTASISDLRKFNAMQHFAYYIDVNHIEKVKPWGDNLTEHFLSKLRGYASREDVGYISVGTVYKWIQDMTDHNQLILLSYVLTYHLDKYTSTYEGKPLD